MCFSSRRRHTRCLSDWSSDVCSSDLGAVAVAVRDYGVGLAPGEVHLVFDRFWRADPARARGTGGTGLGLAIALEDARIHGGWLEAWGESGNGALFRLTLPRAAGADLNGSPDRKSTRLNSSHLGHS